MKAKLLLCLALVLSGNILCHADETNVAPTVTMSIGVNGMTNTSTVTIGNTNSAKEFAGAVATNYEKFILSATNVMPTNFAPALPMVAGVMKTNATEMLTSPAMDEVMAAEEFLKGLKMQGHLPGMSSDSHGTVTTGVMPEARFRSVSYPFAVTWHIVLLGDSFTNHYTVVRPKAGASWQLKRAWRTDAEGQTVKEWQTK